MSRQLIHWSVVVILLGVAGTLFLDDIQLRP
jgi:hypothetical protein